MEETKTKASLAWDIITGIVTIALITDMFTDWTDRLENWRRNRKQNASSS